MLVLFSALSRRGDPIELSVINVITIMISSSDSSGGLSHDKLLLRVHDHMLLRDGETGGGGGGGGKRGEYAGYILAIKYFCFCFLQNPQCLHIGWVSYNCYICVW